MVSTEFMVFKSRSIYLLLSIDAVGFSDGSYTWVIEPVDGRTGYTYWYRFGLQYSGTYVYPKPFFIDY